MQNLNIFEVKTISGGNDNDIDNDIKNCSVLTDLAAVHECYQPLLKKKQRLLNDVMDTLKQCMDKFIEDLEVKKACRKIIELENNSSKNEL